MRWLTEKDIRNKLNNNNYDIRTMNKEKVRFVDQKCTPDVLCIVCDCILDYIEQNGNDYFTAKDIWMSDYAINNVKNIFKKPDLTNESAKSEYDKFFPQPMELLAFAGVLELDIERYRKSKRNFYRVADETMLTFIAIREINAVEFLNVFMERVLTDSGLFQYFESFFERQDNTSLQTARAKFIQFIHKYTNIKGDYEPKRIFPKVLNPMCFKRNIRGIEDGNITSNIVTMTILTYNKDNFRDIYLEKPKGMTRKEYVDENHITIRDELTEYQVMKAKRLLRMYNDEFKGGISEVNDGSESTEYASEMHHIFPKNEFPTIKAFIENLIALTPTQHRNYAHVIDKTTNYKIINRDYQYLCLMSKSSHIKENLLNEEYKIYDFSKFKEVLATGLDNDRFYDIEEMDFNEINRMIEIYYN